MKYAATVPVLLVLSIVIAAQELSPPPGTQILVKVEEDVRLDRLQPSALLRFTKVSGAVGPEVALPRGSQVYAEVARKQQQVDGKQVTAFVLRLVRGEWNGTVVRLEGELLRLYSDRKRPLTVWADSCDQPGETPQRRGMSTRPSQAARV